MKSAAAIPKHPHRETTVAVYRRAVMRVIAHLTENLADEHTLNDMADVAMLSPFHFNRIFREVTGVSPVRYLYALRIAEAQRQLLTTDQKVIDICYSVGYNSLGSFNNRFVSLVGYAPRQVRAFAERIDPDSLRRMLAACRSTGPHDGTDNCAMYGRVDIPRGFSGVVVAALFPGPPSNAYPVSCVLAENGLYTLPPVPKVGDYAVMAVGLEWRENMVDFLLQPDCLRAAIPPFHLTPAGLSSPIHFHLSRREAIDPPVPPCLAFRFVDKLLRMRKGASDMDDRVARSLRSVGAPRRPSVA